MLNRKNSFLLIAGMALLSSCSVSTQKVADIGTPGLVEGIYDFQSIEGQENLPNGWEFTEKSYFEFKKSENGEIDVKYESLPNGLWAMNKFTYENGQGNCITSGYVMEWHNSPFENIKSLRTGGVGNLSDNTVMFNMVPTGGEYHTPNWCNVYDVGCYIFSANKHEFSKRKVKIRCNDRESNFLFSVVFSNE